MALTLYVLSSASCESIFGSPQDRLTPKSDLYIIAQRDDCSEFLVLSNTAYEGLTEFTSYEGFTFTYSQSWGLSVNADVVQRVKQDIRAKAYPSIEDQLDVLYHQGFEAWKEAITTVKASIPIH